MSTLAAAVAHMRRTIVQGIASPDSHTVSFEYGTPLPTTTLNAAQALELVSRLANVSPNLSSGFFARSDRTVDGMYEMLLLGSRPTNDADLPFYEAIKSRALADFQEELGSFDGPSKYRPAHPTPTNWADLTQTVNWTSHRIDATDALPMEPQTVNPKLGQWLTSTLITEQTVTDSSLVGVKHLQSILTANASGVAIEMQEPDMLLAPSARTQLRENFLRTRPFRAHLARARQRPLNVAFSDHVELAHTRHIDLTDTQGPDAGTAPIVDFELQPWNFPLVVEQNTLPKPVQVDRMLIEFDLCVLQLRRNWLSDGFLAMNNWFVPGFRKGEFSRGLSELENDGLLAYMPLACVLTKDVRIFASWTNDDIAAIGESVAAGPFSLSGRAFDVATGKLSIPGVQALAWICSPFKSLPPNDDPSLSD